MQQLKLQTSANLTKVETGYKKDYSGFISMYNTKNAKV